MNARPSGSSVPGSRQSLAAASWAQEERITVGEILDAVEQRAEWKKLRSLRKIRSHAKAVRKTFAFTRAVDVSTGDIEQYIKERKDTGRAEATINRELEILRCAYRLAVKGKLISAARVPDIELLRLDNIRQGFFERAEIEALLQRIPDRDLHDFIEWGFRTGQRKGEIAKLTWDMLDRTFPVWVLRLPGAIAKNKTGRSLGLAGETRTIMERRLARRRLDCPLIFHRTSKGKADSRSRISGARGETPSRPRRFPKTDSSTTSGDPRCGH